MHGNGGDLGEDFGSSVVCVEALHTQGILWWAASLPYHRRSKKAGLGLFHYFWTWLECHMNTTCIYGTAAPPTSHPSLTACNACATACRPAGWLLKNTIFPDIANVRSVLLHWINPPLQLSIFKRGCSRGRMWKAQCKIYEILGPSMWTKPPEIWKHFSGFFFLLQI